MTARRGYLLRGGTIIDGSGGARRTGDILMRGDRIVGIGRGPHFEEMRGVKEIDIGGRVVCPGFIDVHTHDDLAVVREPSMITKIAQGVTTVIIGNCGIGVAPASQELRRQLLGRCAGASAVLGTVDSVSWRSIAEYVDAISQSQPILNVGFLAPHNAIRLFACGSVLRPASRVERCHMAGLVEEWMEVGALGFSTGLIYEPGRAADSIELTELARAAAPSGLYVTHVRDESLGLLHSIAEAYAVAERAEAELHVSHLKAAGQAMWGRVGEAIDLLESVSATTDVYPYTASSSMMEATLRAIDGMGDASAGDVQVVCAPGALEAEGKTLSELAAAWNASIDQCVSRLAASCPSGVSVMAFLMCEPDVEDVLRWSSTMVGSDGLPTNGLPHPRLYGTFPRVLSKYVREKNIIDLETAINKMTSLPARRFGIAGRGQLREGAFADVVVFDHETVGDMATFANPRQPPRGIDYVFVNGDIAWSRGHVSVSRAGRVLRRGGEGRHQSAVGGS